MSSFAGVIGSAAGKASILRKHVNNLPNPVHPHRRRSSAEELAEESQQQRAALQSMLQLHLSHSSPDAAQPSGIGDNSTHHPPPQSS